MRDPAAILAAAARTLDLMRGPVARRITRSEGAVKPGDPPARVPRHSGFLALRLLENEGKCVQDALKQVEDHGLLLSCGDRRPLLPGGRSQFMASCRRAAEYVS
jgi:hypothetical protein